MKRVQTCAGFIFCTFHMVVPLKISGFRYLSKLCCACVYNSCVTEPTYLEEKDMCKKYSLFRLLLEYLSDQGLLRERSGSVIECLTRDRGAVGSSLTGITALCP